LAQQAETALAPVELESVLVALALAPVVLVLVAELQRITASVLRAREQLPRQVLNPLNRNSRQLRFREL
jgi:hypothetical protein